MKSNTNFFDLQIIPPIGIQQRPLGFNRENFPYFLYISFQNMKNNTFLYLITNELGIKPSSFFFYQQYMNARSKNL